MKNQKPVINTNDFKKFMEKELFPESFFPYVDSIELLKIFEKSRNSSFADLPLRWFELTVNQGVKMVESPNPNSMLSVFKNYKKIDQNLFNYFKQKMTFGRHAVIGRAWGKKSYFRYKRDPNYIKMISYIKKAKNEKKFIYRIDMKSYFKSIYTHSLDWVINGGVIRGKSVFVDTLGKDVDNLAMSMSANQTNGLLIGPNLSRIIAEIIGMKIDEKIYNIFQNDPSITSNRFVDDIYIVSTEKIIDFKEKVQEFNIQLIPYNLSTNDKKTGYESKSEITLLTSRINRRRRTMKWLVKGKFISNQDMFDLYFHLNGAKKICKLKKQSEIDTLMRMFPTYTRSKNTYKFKLAQRALYSPLSKLVVEKKISFSKYLQVTCAKVEISEYDINFILGIKSIYSNRKLLSKSDKNKADVYFAEMISTIKGKVQSKQIYGVKTIWDIYLDILTTNKKLFNFNKENYMVKGYNW